ncbi:MAG TPA: LysE family transporter [Polyangia bacterium]|nr:LysE family transporter [Polyangia bacterium]
MQQFWSGFLLSLSLSLDLGLVNVAIVRTALNRGGRAAFLVGAGSCLGDLVYFVAALFGVATLLRSTPFRWAIWIGGTAVLLFLAVKMVREVLRPRLIDLDDRAAPASNGASLFGWGVALALASPTAILWFAAVGGSVIAASGGTKSQLIPFAAGFAVAGIAWSAALAAAASLFERVGGRKVARVLAVVSALLFLYFAGVVFLRGWVEMRALGR